MLLLFLFFWECGSQVYRTVLLNYLWGGCLRPIRCYTVRMFNKVQQRLQSKVEAQEIVGLLTCAVVDLTIVFMFNRAKEAEMSDKKFAVAGWSRLNGVLKVRVAKDLDRVKVLVRNGHTDVNLWTLPNEMTRTEAAAWLLVNHPLPVPDVAPAAAVGETAAEAAVETAVEAAAEAAEGETAAAEDPVEIAVENSDGSEDTVDEERITFEQALEQIPLRENGRFLSRERREEMARELLQQA